MFRLALPVAATYLGLMTMGLVDLIWVGRVGTTATGAVGIGTSFFSWFMVLGIGLLAGMDYLVASAFGAGRLADCRATLAHGLRIAAGLGLPLTAVLVFFSYHLNWFSLNPQVIPEASSYLRVLSLSLLPIYIFTVFRNYLQSVGVVIPSLVTLLVANALNALLNYAFIFGHWGAPRWNVTGSAVATLVSRVWMMSAVGLVVWRWNRRHGVVRGSLDRGRDRERWLALWRLGLPAAGQTALEVGVFVASTALAGTLQPQALAAHQIVLNIASLTFMVPLGIGAATAVLVGQAIGAGDPARARSSGWTGLRFGAGFMTLSSALLLWAARPVLGLYTVDPSVMDMARQLLLIAGLFQISDGTQTVLTGALRGAADTRNPMYANLVGHWIFGLPLGATLCFAAGLGIRGLWIGLAVGLTTVAVWLLAVWARRSRHFSLAESLPA